MRLYHSQETYAPGEILRVLEEYPIKLLKIYPQSFRSLNGLTYGLIRTDQGKKLLVLGEKASVLDDPFQGICHHLESTIKMCDLSRENTQCLLSLFPFTRPVPLREFPSTIGIEDFLGLATPGYLKAVRNFCIKPIVMRRPESDILEVIRNAAWSVFQENHREGYGFDAGPLKSLSEVKSVLEAGASMVTLDLSERLNPEAFKEPKVNLRRRMEEEIDEGDLAVFFHYFLNKPFQLEGPLGRTIIRFDEETIQRNILFFHKAIDFAEEVYGSIRQLSGFRSLIDLEISLRTTNILTSPESHLFLIIALRHRGLRIDYLEPQMKGDRKENRSLESDGVFLKQVYQHLLIARDYGGYKISIHPSGHSESLLSGLGEAAMQGLHVKLAGISRIEAMTLIDLIRPSLFSEIHESTSPVSAGIALLKPAAADVEKNSNFDENPGDEFPAILNRLDRLLLQEGNIFKNRIDSFLNQYEEDYWDRLQNRLNTYLLSSGVEKTKGEGGEEARKQPVCEGGVQ